MPRLRKKDNSFATAIVVKHWDQRIHLREEKQTKRWKIREKEKAPFVGPLHRMTV